MTDLWDEKPESVKLDMTWGRHYNKGEMDAWLEKVRGWIGGLNASFNIMIAENERLKPKADKWDELLKQYPRSRERYETVKTIIKKAPKPKPVKSGNIVFAWNKPLNETEYNLWLKELRAAIGE